MVEYEVSQLREADLDDVADIIRRSKQELTFERAPTVEELKAYTFKNEEFRPEGSWLVRSDGAPVAYATVLIEANRLKAGLDDGYMEFEIVPEERGKGLEQRLTALACEYIRSRGVGKVKTRSASTESWRVEALLSEGFSEAYRVFFLVRRAAAGPVPEIPVPEGVRLVRRPYKECGDEEMTRIVGAFNDSFQDHFSFAPERPETFIRYRDASEDPECFSLAMVNDEVAGLCLSSEDRTYNEENGTKWGWVNILGVRRPYRRGGVGRFLLADGMNWVREQGMDTTYIGVYAKNETALDMYTSVGFVKDRESMWLEKSLR
ncbi:MAG: GNAT family N-acetyltransferase [Thermoplasmata archaeon]